MFCPPASMIRSKQVIALLPSVSNSLLLLLLTLYGIGRQVWVGRVFENAPESLATLPQFYLAAFLNTEFLVQLLALVTLASVLYLARATARRHSRFHAAREGVPGLINAASAGASAFGRST